ncbi:MAG: preprotein translocase subunit SecY [Candidatus Bathyarchaeota archaeon]|nr:MAG: preprotein translocase subunit SecY [Candidatus Bathyarchaeum tardum]WNZ28605.1 MAG: preprotein translocase subunit SecY [Candidatus Bathyarchaeota archaeon]
MAGKFLSFFGPLSRFMPEVGSPSRKVSFNEKLFWTAMALIIYLVMSQINLFNVTSGGQGFDAYQIIFASNQGTLTTLGIGPIVTGGLILQLLIGSSIINADLGNPEDRALFTAATKFFAVLLTVVQASAYLLGGVFGVLDTVTAVIIFAQLIFAGIILMLLDEMMQKGWGLGSGISLFILGGVAQRIMWDSFGITAVVADGRNYGAFIALGEVIASGSPIVDAFLRVDANGVLTTYPSMIGLIATVAVFILVIYMEGVRVELPISHANYRGFRGKYPIKLLYVSNLPVIFASALFANVAVVAQLLYTQPWGPDNFFAQLLGTYATTDPAVGPQLVGGLAYYVTAPNGIAGLVADPLRAAIYSLIMVVFSVIFSLTWLEVGGLGPGTVAKQLVDSGMQIPGFRRSGKSIEMILQRYIPVVTVLGGAIVGLIAAVAGFFGVFGSGVGILLAVGILYQYYQLLVQEQVAEMYPALGKVLG